MRRGMYVTLVRTKQPRSPRVTLAPAGTQWSAAQPVAPDRIGNGRAGQDENGAASVA
jgi:hypothetical protein